MNGLHKGWVGWPPPSVPTPSRLRRAVYERMRRTGPMVKVVLSVERLGSVYYAAMSPLAYAPTRVHARLGTTLKS